MELGLGPLVGSAMSRGVSRGGCELKKPLGSLSVDGWDCVPAPLAVWPEVSQHCSLQAVELGQVLVLMSKQDVSLQMGNPRYVHLQILCPQKTTVALCLLRRPSKTSK